MIFPQPFQPCPAEKFSSGDVLKGHGFSRAVQVLYFCHPERALAREGSAFQAFSATSLAVPFRIKEREDGNV